MRLVPAGWPRDPALSSGPQQSWERAYFAEAADMPEFIGATLGAVIALAAIAVAYQRWGYSA